MRQADDCEQVKLPMTDARVAINPLPPSDDGRSARQHLLLLQMMIYNQLPARPACALDPEGLLILLDCGKSIT